MTEPPKLGDIWRYPFLWSYESESGETEGRKSRPVSLIFLMPRRDGKTEVFFVPVTTKDSSKREFAIEVPEIEKRRAGLDTAMRLWVIADETNLDVLSESFYFEPDARIGTFSAVFVKEVQRKMIHALKSRKLRQVSRWDPAAN